MNAFSGVSTEYKAMNAFTIKKMTSKILISVCLYLFNLKFQLAKSVKVSLKN